MNNQGNGALSLAVRSLFSTPNDKEPKTCSSIFPISHGILLFLVEAASKDLLCEMVRVVVETCCLPGTCCPGGQHINQRCARELAYLAAQVYTSG